MEKKTATFNGEPCKVVKIYPGKKTGAPVAVVKFVDGYAGSESAFPIWSKPHHVMLSNIVYI